MMAKVVAPYLPYDRLRTVADEFLAKYHAGGEIPIPIERIVEVDFELDIVPVPGLLDGFDVDAFITSDLSEIRVDRFILQRRLTRYRFSLAHELAHLLIHRDILKALKFSTVAEWKAAMASIPEDALGWIEWQAYSLAGLILVPTGPLNDVFSTKAEEAMKAGIDVKKIDSDSRRIVESNIAKHFEVSGEVIARRMEKEGMWQT